MTLKRLSPEQIRQIAVLGARLHTPAEIHQITGIMVANVYYWLRKQGVGAYRRAKPAPSQLAATLPLSTMLAPNEPGIVGEKAIKDDLDRCDAKWAKLFGARRSLAYTRRGGHA